MTAQFTYNPTPDQLATERGRHAARQALQCQPD